MNDKTIISAEPIVQGALAVETTPRWKHRTIAFILASFNLALGAAIVYSIVNLILAGPTVLTRFIGTTDGVNSLLVYHLAFTGVGASLGAVLHNLFGLYVHVCVLDDFEPRFIGSYVLGPLAAGLLGIAMFFVIQGGLLAVGDQSSQAIPRAALFYLALGILIGFAFDAVLLRIDAVARQIFGARSESFVENAMSRALDQLRGRAENQQRQGSGQNPPKAR